jgi:predicted ester cyclase
MTQVDEKALVRSFFDRVWCQKDLAYHHEILAPDFSLVALWTNTSLGRSGEADREVSLGVISRWIKGFPDLRISIEEQVGDGGYVASRHRYWGTHANEFMGLPATGVPVLISGNTIMKVTGDKITISWTCWDGASFLRQIGVVPPQYYVHRLDEQALVPWRDDGCAARVDPDQARALVRRVHQELWSEGALDVADELVSPGFVGHAPGCPPAKGPDGMKRLVQAWRSGLSELEFAADAQHAEGGRVATRLTVRGRHTGEFLGFPPTGDQVMAAGIAITRVIDGKVVADWSEIDMIGLLRLRGAGPQATASSPVGGAPADQGDRGPAGPPAS